MQTRQVDSESRQPSGDRRPTAQLDAPWANTLPDLASWAAARYAARPAIDFLGRRWTYGELGAQIERLAGGLVHIGVGPGTRVGLLLPNTPYSVLFFFAILRAGGTVVNYNPLYTPRELLAQIQDSGTTIMVTVDVDRIYRSVESIADEAGLERIVLCPLADAMSKGKALLFRLLKRRELARPTPDARIARFAALMAAGTAVASARCQPNDVAVLQYTGGTTGVPKGAMLSHANLLANARQLVTFAGPDALRPGEERVLCVLPLFHVFAMTVSMNVAIGIGAQMILMPQFKLEDLLKTIVRTRPTVLPAVPTLYNAINNAAGARKLDLTSLRICLSGGAPLPAEVQARFEALTGCRLSEGYGLTESSPVASVNPFDGRPWPAGSAGLALPDTVIEIRDPDHPERVMPQGEKGEVCVRGPQVMQGYWKRPQDTAAVMIEGALRTGDIGYVDKDGFLHLVDRIKDLIICSGYNVYPRVIEEALYEHPAVAEAAVIGIADSYRGESPKAFVVLRPGAEASPETLLAFLARRISKIEMPREIELRDTLPRTMVGKLSKKELIAEERLRAAEAAPAPREHVKC